MQHRNYRQPQATSGFSFGVKQPLDSRDNVLVIKEFATV
jgi:hypothetical protein